MELHKCDWVYKDTVMVNLKMRKFILFTSKTVMHTFFEVHINHSHSQWDNCFTL
jgi:hypothetical protein